MSGWQRSASRVVFPNLPAYNGSQRPWIAPGIESKTVTEIESKTVTEPVPILPMPQTANRGAARAVAAAQRSTLPYEPVCAVFRRYLHGEKLKFTPERAMILDAVLRKNGLFEAERLVEDLKSLGHRVSRATAYRTLSHLQDAGIVKQVFLDNKQSYYEVIAGRQTHDYLICIQTGKVIEFSSEKLRQLRDEICREHGFTPISHQFHIRGLSPEASGKTADPLERSAAPPSADSL